MSQRCQASIYSHLFRHKSDVTRLTRTCTGGAMINSNAKILQTLENPGASVPGTIATTTESRETELLAQSPQSEQLPHTDCTRIPYTSMHTPTIARTLLAIAPEASCQHVRTWPKQCSSPPDAITVDLGLTTKSF